MLFGLDLTIVKKQANLQCQLASLFVPTVNK